MCINWNAVCAIATAVATLVALCTSFQARNELKSALKMQEQSKNVGLLDKRIELVEKIRSDKPVPEWTLRVLFDNNADIIRHYAALQELKSKKREAQNELDILIIRGGIRENQIPQEHSEIKHRVVDARESVEREKTETLQALENFITDSIKSLEKEKRKRMPCQILKGDNQNDNH